MKAHGHTRTQVATVLAIDVSTVRVYFDLFLEEGIAALKRLNYREPLCAYNGWDTSYAVISVADKEERNDGKDEGSRD